mgnify:CR=1 FL=1
MKRVFKWIGLLVLALVLLAAALGAHTWYAKPLSINWFYTRVFAQFALDNPEILTSLRILDQYGLNFTAGELSDSSPAAG